MQAKSESDATSMAASSPPRSPKRASYFVQSPSSHGAGGSSSAAGGYKSRSPSVQATPVSNNSPANSPLRPSYASRHSRGPAITRFSSKLRPAGSGVRTSWDRKAVNGKGWPECTVIEEEGSYHEFSSDSGLSRGLKIVLGFISLVLLFTTICLVIWGVSRRQEPDVVVKSLVMDNFYAGAGTDHSGVPTKLVTLNCSLNMVVSNPASIFGIHVTSGPVRLLYSEIAIGVGQVRKYYQQKNSHQAVSAVIHGEKVPLYGAGGAQSLSSKSGMVPLTLDFELTTRGYIIGAMVRVTHKLHVNCKIKIDPKKTRPIRLPKDACAVDRA